MQKPTVAKTLTKVFNTTIGHRPPRLPDVAACITQTAKVSILSVYPWSKVRPLTRWNVSESR